MAKKNLKVLLDLDSNFENGLSNQEIEDPQSYQRHEESHQFDKFRKKFPFLLAFFLLVKDDEPSLFASS